MTDETIFALASGPGRGGVAVIRVSGPKASCLLQELLGDAGVRAMAAPRLAVLGTIRDPRSAEALDQALVLWFPGPHSFTGEDVVEIHIHGGPAVIEGVLLALGTYSDCRLAEPGEFSRRAFSNGKLDLTQAEGIADLVDAETAAQRRQALRQASGGLAADLRRWREELIAGLAHLEATIDFAEEDLPEDVDAAARKRVETVCAEMQNRLADGGRGERLRDGVRIALLGAPNAGKSSFLNLLAARDAAIVSETAGTTRDVIEVHIELSGCPVIVADTAGLRESNDEIEQEGVRRARARAAEADLCVVLIDASLGESEAADLSGFVSDHENQVRLTLLNKIDLLEGKAPPEVQGKDGFPVSMKTGKGVKEAILALEQEVRKLAGESDAPALTRTRHRETLERASAALARGTVLWHQTGGSELVAEDLRLAAREVGRVTGHVDVEDLLEVIFSDFCIGK